MLGISLLATGCQTANYRATELPNHMRVAQMRRKNDINLASLASSGTSSSQIGPGDLVEVTIASGNQEEVPEPIQARVSDDGKIVMPLMGELHVAGLEPFEAGQRISTLAVERGYYRQPSVVLRVSEQAVNRVTVLGSVKEPGVYELPRGGSDLLSAVAAAGGMTKFASTEVEVMRHEQPTFLADGESSDSNIVMASYDDAEAPAAVTALNKSTDLAANSQPKVRTERIDLAEASARKRVDYRVNDRDVIMVHPQEKRMIHVAGLVNKPNQFELPSDQDVHVLDAIAMAGGVKSPVADKVYVIRQLENMKQPAVVEVSLTNAKKNGKENLLLTSGDLVSVESTALTTSVDALSTFFRVGLSLGGNVVAF